MSELNKEYRFSSCEIAQYFEQNPKKHTFEELMLKRNIECSYQVTKIANDGVKELELRPLNNYEMYRDYQDDSYVIKEKD